MSHSSRMPLFDGVEKRSVLEGIVQRVVYSRESYGWTVLRFMPVGQSKEITITGNLFGISPGERVKISGEWIDNERYGRQFNVSAAECLIPTTQDEVRRYLSSGAIKGIGKVMAARLVTRFGGETINVIENAPERLSEVEGIGKRRVADIQQAVLESRNLREVTIFCQTFGISTSLVPVILRQYGAAAITAIRKNPYRLAIDIVGVGFQTADRIAQALGVEKTGDLRIESALCHLLRESTDRGNVFAPRGDLISDTMKLVAASPNIIDPAIDRLASQGRFIVEENRCYLPAHFFAEKSIAEQIANLVRAMPTTNPQSNPLLLQFEQSPLGIQLAPKQVEAVRAALSHHMVIITGGPGTGKTTLVRNLYQLFASQTFGVVLAAPTGRAAKRLAESTGADAVTLHRLLDYNPRRGRFERHHGNPLDARLIIVDEFSMVDIQLAHQLLSAIRPGARLVIVGDVDQLPSIGPGTVLRDIIDSGAVPVVRLDQIFRQVSGSGIIENAHKINRGEFPLIEEQATDFFFIERNEPEQILETIESVVQTRIPDRFGFDPVLDIQVLTPMQRGLLGNRHLNRRLQTILNPAAQDNEGLNVGDKVMQVRNNYELDIFNGDIGVVESIKTANRAMMVRFQDRLVRYEGNRNDLQLAYACTIHKSQGSEYPAVVLPLHMQHYVMLDRNLLYTAVTRAKKLLVIVGSKKALTLAIRQEPARSRHAYLRERIRQRSRKNREPQVQRVDVGS